MLVWSSGAASIGWEAAELARAVGCAAAGRCGAVGYQRGASSCNLSHEGWPHAGGGGMCGGRVSVDAAFGHSSWPSFGEHAVSQAL